MEDIFRNEIELGTLIIITDVVYFEICLNIFKQIYNIYR